MQGDLAALPFRCGAFASAWARNSYVHLRRDLPIYRRVRTDYLVKPYPASTAVGVTELAVPDLEVEIEACAPAFNV